MTRRYLAIALWGATLTLPCAGLEQTTTASPKQPNRVAIATENVKQMLLLMDTDKSGKISKAEWMKFMSEEFDRLDKDHSGELDPKELMQSRMTFRHVNPEVQGK